MCAKEKNNREGEGIVCLSVVGLQFEIKEGLVQLISEQNPVEVRGQDCGYLARAFWAEGTESANALRTEQDVLAKGSVHSVNEAASGSCTCALQAAKLV